MTWVLRKKPQPKSLMIPKVPSVPKLPRAPKVKPVRPVKPIAPVGYEFVWREKN